VPFLARLRTGPLAGVTLLIHLVRDTGEAPFVEELSLLATRQPLLELRTLAGTDALDRALALLDTVPGLPNRQAWLCGPPPVVGRFAQALRAHGVPPDRIHAERFDFR